jgi:hypothetical protein
LYDETHRRLQSFETHLHAADGHFREIYQRANDAGFFTEAFTKLTDLEKAILLDINVGALGDPRLLPLNILRSYQDNEAVFNAACAWAQQMIQPPPPSEAAGQQGRPLIQPGDLVVITAGYPLYEAGTTNLVKLHMVS